MSNSSNKNDTSAEISSQLQHDFFVGFYDPALRFNAAGLLRQVRPADYSFIGTALSNSTSTAEQVRTDVVELPSRWWTSSVIGIMQYSQDEMQQEDIEVNLLTPQLWRSQLSWAWHMSLPAVILPPFPASSDKSLHAYAQQLSQLAHRSAQESASFRLWVPLSVNSDEQVEAWLKVLQWAKYPSNVGIILSILDEDKASSSGSAPIAALSTLHRLHTLIGLGPILAVTLPTHSFLINKQGFPTLAKRHQAIVTTILQRVGRGVRWLIQQSSSESTQEQSLDPRFYLQYLHHLRTQPKVTDVIDTPNAVDETPYLDQLQTPLQPLHDHLRYSIYETFEGDPIKYARYESAARVALYEFFAAKKGGTCHVMVAGAGRGPLVTRVLQAFAALPTITKQQGISLQVLAVEKNPSAMVYLRAKHQLAWSTPKKNATVTLLSSDIRDLSAEQCAPVDIVVSELLGSFGCNELSPECLDALLARCKPGTKSIPAQYTSYLAPINAISIHHDISSKQPYYPSNSIPDSVTGRIAAHETPYVVRPHAASQLYPEQACWSFEHPNTKSKDSERSVSLSFTDRVDGFCTGCGYSGRDAHSEALHEHIFGQAGQKQEQLHETATLVTGLLGSFSAQLYQPTSPDSATAVGLIDPATELICSMAPFNFSKGMFSWFPLYFSLGNEPLYVPCGGKIAVQISRHVEPGVRVWYEWSAQVLNSDDDSLLSTTGILNANGRSSHVGLTTTTT